MSNALLDDSSQWLDDGDDFDVSALIAAESQRHAPSQRSSKCPAYTINWTLCSKKNRLNKLTGNAVQNIQDYPSVYWETSLGSEIDAIVRGKGLGNNYEPDETQITMTINARGEDDVPKRYTGLNISWSQIDDQIESWSDLVHKGRKLTVKIIFIYKETGQHIAAKRSGRSATAAQLSERASIQNREGSTDEVPIWERVYDLLECPGAGCDVGPYCWRNPDTGTRHAVATNILLKIVDYVEKGGKFNEHSDLPKHYRNEILNPPTKRKQGDVPQINITNVIPGAESAPPAKRVKIEGHRDNAVRQYRDWHCSQVGDESWKKDFHAIADLTLRARLTLERIFEAQDEEIRFFISNKIPRGIAHQWVSMVDKWPDSEQV
ncbi:unnamed protein product [Clonostachys rhizophaga]|uniref:Uncharacterized protein n=2 Tax=Clonostachys rhizophaga TaxID=160324 RepID=A0A9N9VCJ3_9HYPO|nr:unnamed protein product [Clonostachys rhizophaga]